MVPQLMRASDGTPGGLDMTQGDLDGGLVPMRLVSANSV